MPPALAQLIPERSMLTLGGPSSRAVMSPEGLPVGGGSAVRAQVPGAGTGAVWSGAPQWLVSLGQGPGTAHLCAQVSTQVYAQAASWPVRTGQVVSRHAQWAPWRAHSCCHPLLGCTPRYLLASPPSQAGP